MIDQERPWSILKQALLGDDQWLLESLHRGPFLSLLLLRSNLPMCHLSVAVQAA